MNSPPARTRRLHDEVAEERGARREPDPAGANAARSAAEGTTEEDKQGSAPDHASDIDWIEFSVNEWAPGGDWRIGHMIPAGYPAYLRILHPATRETEEDLQDISWRDVAAISGLTVTALSSFEDLLPPHDIGVTAPYCPDRRATSATP